MVLSGAVDLIPGLDIVAKVDVENATIVVEINGEVVYDSED